MDETPAKALRRLQDREEIRDCVARYARGIDRLDRELTLSAYHADAIDDHGKFLGTPAEFVDWAFTMHRTFHLSHQHSILNQTCELDGDVAHAETYFLFASMNVSGPPWTLSGGRYIDRLERRSGRWAIAHRLCVRDWATTDSTLDPTDPTSLTATQASLTPALRSFFRGAPHGRRDTGDPSYDRPLVIDPVREAHWRDLQADQGD
ncbi:nuclear transport factor 2 family protein [Agrococcus baldri]|uniref:SnoaL-like domain-containing protein n=1 Tax=Agrococcus baldri TaxID=153730 RepID=A0AA87RES1_9MICO|nr:nuclear transport factor 2 family protein [Agrococcus baldri]GEK79135.1 hypothetical protein ABA31_04860 [Agrococcus baldri]